MIKKNFIFGCFGSLILSLVVVNGCSASTQKDFGLVPIGDIMFMDVRPFWKQLFNIPYNPGVSNDHAVISMGGIYFIEAGNYTIFNKISYLDGVQLHSKAWLNLFFNNFSCGMVVNVTFKQRCDAVRFACSQLGYPYQNPYVDHVVYDSWHANFDPDDNTDPFSDWWFCSELTWASYYQQGINIDATPEKVLDDDGKYYFRLGCDDIRQSENVSLYQYRGW